MILEKNAMLSLGQLWGGARPGNFEALKE